MMKDFDMMILFVVEIAAVVDDDLTILSMMNTNHYLLLTRISRERTIESKTIRLHMVVPMDIDCLQRISERYRKDYW